MRLIINGMSLPRECSECLFSCCDISVGAPAQCIILVEHSARYSRLKNCPLSEIPTPHGRLIDADRLIAVLKSAIPYEQRTSTVLCMIKNIENAPTIIEAEK